MNRKIKKALASFLVILIVLTSVPLSGFVGLDIGGIFATKAAAASYSVGDIIEYGNYPQSKVTDSATIAALDSITKSWKSLGYYSGTGNFGDGQMKPSDYMKYADLQYGGSKYRAIYFTEYRPYYTSNSLSLAAYEQKNNGYYINTTYYFKYEPLKWRVLDPNDGLIMCESIIDSQPYQNTVYADSNGECYQDSTKSAYANDYAKSSIRKWLNDDFYNTAFSEAQKANVETTALNNDSFSSSYPQYNSAPTNDKIFLLSYDEVQNSAYGFSSSPAFDSARQAKGTDYAKCQGLEDVYSSGCSWWWLRSPNSSSYETTSVDQEGYAGFNFIVNETSVGVWPACKLSNLKSDISQSDSCATGHSYTAVITDPTCTKGGFTTYTCECGDTYVADETAATGHIPAEAVKENEVASTCTVAGSFDSVVYCAACKTYEISRESIVLPLADHKTKSYEAKAASCTENGWEAYEECENCSYSTYKEIAKLNHSYNAVVTAPTCTKEGFTTYTCSCGDSYVADQKPATGHSYNAVVTAPTCTKEGFTTYTCSCGESYVADEKPVIDHKDNDGDGKCDGCSKVLEVKDNDNDNGNAGSGNSGGSFFDKIKEFFNKIIEFFRNLFR